jgi:ectoine hydroxylase-related dioxygenase (phytanoyl-CoA dioxygenase family)
MNLHNPNTFEKLNDEQLSLLPTEEDIQQYENLGWYVSEKVLPDSVLDNAIVGANGFYAGERDLEFEASERIANSMDANQILKNNEFVSLQKRELNDLAFHPMVSAIAARLSRTSQIRLFSDSLICKYPSKGSEKGSVGWHSDKAYWPTCTSDSLLTAWIPMQDCTVKMGTLVHLDGSHRWQRDNTLKSLISFNDHKMDDFERYLSTDRPGTKQSLMLLKKGQISFHNCHTIHASYPNLSDRNRMALAVHMQDDANKYQKAFKPDGGLITIGYDTLCGKDAEGFPNYSDPNIFPLMYSENLR